MTITIESLEYCSIIKMPPFVDAQLAAKLRDRFDALLKQANKKVIIDFSGTVKVDSSGIGAIAYLYKKLYLQGLTLELIGLHKQPFRKIKQLGLDEVIKTSC